MKKINFYEYLPQRYAATSEQVVKVRNLIYNFKSGRKEAANFAADLIVRLLWNWFLNHHYKLIKSIKLSEGGLTETAIDVRVILKEALLCNATVVALAHNHPSGSITPSLPDDSITKRVQKACEAVRIYFLDHIIVTDGRYYSYRDSGRL